jgi:predicted acylesterase/phospholipase RssA
MRPRYFRAREVICHAHEPGNSLFVIQDGLALVTISDGESGIQGEAVARLRRGDVVGEMSLITGEPRSATVLAAVPTSVLELDQDEFAAILAQHPAILVNLNRILSHRLARTNLRQVERRRGEAVALIISRRVAALLPRIVSATESASPRSVAALDVRSYSYSQTFSLGMDASLDQPAQQSLDTALGMLDDLLSEHGTVIIVADIDQENVSLLLDNMDRAVVVASESEVQRLTLTPGAYSTEPTTKHQSIEVVLVSADTSPASAPADKAPAEIEGMPVIRVFKLGMDGLGLDSGLEAQATLDRDVAWLGRHLSRTKLGLALGAGGAKGYAHIGALYLLEEAGYTVDYVAGSSIGAMVGSWLALGMNAAEVEATMRHAFSPESVASMFKLSMTGTSTGLDTMTRVCRESTHDRTFADLVIPLVVMSVDLNTRQPAPIREGPLWQALLAATALAGMFPPYQRDGQRLVDGLALVPVPTGSVVEAGADISISVNIMSRETLPAWPGEMPPEPAPAKAGSRMLDTLLEVMDLAQLDSSTRHAALADVVVTPRFGPSSWRDFHLADLFLAAGREAAEEQLASLSSLARPQAPNLYSKGEVHGSTAVHI